MRPTLTLTLLLLALLTSCSSPTSPPSSSSPASTQSSVLSPHLSSSARRQTSLISLSFLNLPPGPSRLALLKPTGPDDWTLTNPVLYAVQTPPHSPSAPLASPAADQLLSTPLVPTDFGSTLTPLPNTANTFSLPAPAPLLLQLFVPPTLTPGTYTLPITLTPAHGPPTTTHLLLTVSDITLPTEPAILSAATTTTSDLAALYPASFGALQATYLDRADPDHKPALDQLDSLVKTAHFHGISLFLEDLAPSVRIDQVGRVLLDWDAYDRTIFPYMDGTAFSDHLGLPIWIAPLPPRRIRDTPTQLRQYWLACLEHFHDKAWNATPALLHPAFLDPKADPDLLRQINEILNKDIDKSVAVIGTPDLAATQKQMWVIDDHDRRLPPVGDLATPESVRLWPWMCHARNLRGFLWPHAVGAPNSPTPPLLLATPTDPQLSLRLAWLTAGINDSEHFGLLVKRSDPALAAEVLAGVVGRTGIPSPIPPTPEFPWQTPPPGYLYAGWPTDPKTWAALPAMVDRLIQAHAPGQNVQVPPDDPLSLTTKMYLAQSHRPVARVHGFRFELEPGRDGGVLHAHTELLIENPVSAPADLDIRWNNLPGDFQLAKNSPANLPANGLLAHTATAIGHLESLTESLKPVTMQLTERAGGAVLDLPIQLPIYRMRPTSQPPRIDGHGKDWSDVDAGTALLGPMPIHTRYLSRPDLLNSQLRVEANPATVRWTYDSDYLYALISCPQTKVADERTSEWPIQDRRWWGTDGVQIQIVGGARLNPGTRIVQLGIKPSGTVLSRAATLQKDQPVQWTDGPTGFRYGITTNDKGYTVELAIPRKWFPVDHDKDPNIPLWRLNILRHQEAGLLSTTWSGPLVDDTDVGMMGLLLGSGD